MATRELPSALQLLGVDARSPPIAKLIGEVVARAEAQTGAGFKGLLGPRAFAEIVHRALTQDFAPELPSVADPPSSGAGASTGGGGGKKAAAAASKPGATARTGRADLAPAAGGGGTPVAAAAPPLDERTRLARAFILCESQFDETIAARDVPAVLWEAQIVTESARLASLTPKPTHAHERIPFERLVALALGSSAAAAVGAAGADKAAAGLFEPLRSGPSSPGRASPPKASQRAPPPPTSPGAAPLPILALTTKELVLSRWLLDHPGVHSLCVVLRGALGPEEAVGGVGGVGGVGPWESAAEASAAARLGGGSESADPYAVASEPMPLVLRSATARKAPSVPIDLVVRLPPSAVYLHIEVMHEPVPGAQATLARGELDLTQLYGATYPLPYTVPLYDARAVQAATLCIVAERANSGARARALALPAPSTAEAPSPLPARGVSAADAVVSLEAELQSLRLRASELQSQRDAASVALRTERRLRGGASDGIAHAGRVDGVGGGGRGRYEDAEGAASTVAARAASWRLSSVHALDRMVGSLERRHRDGTAAELARLLQRSRMELATVVSDHSQPPGAVAAPSASNRCAKDAACYMGASSAV